MTALAELVMSPTSRVLMVDDDRDDFLLVERMLRRVERNYHLDWVADASAAYDVILRQEHDVYLIDLKLGPDDGLDLIDRCRGAGCDRPMILLTGHEAPRFDEQSIQRGAADYLSKNRIDAGWVDRSIRHAIARWNLQQGLESAEGRFRRAFAVAPIGIVLTDDRMGVVDSNEAFLTLVGRGEAELEGSSLVDLFDGEAGADVSRAFEASSQDDAGIARVSTRLEALDGLVRYVDIVIARFGGRPSDATHIVQAVDLTDLTLIRRRLEELLREKDEFLASVSHELRTPLTAVLGFASVLLQDGVVLSELEASGLLRTVHQQALELSNIIEDLLVAARAGTDQLHVAPVRLAVRREIDDVVAAFVLNGTPPPTVSGNDHEVVADPIRLRQILRNLYTNALRFGGPNVAFESERVGHEVMLRVTDDGPGPDPELVESIFEPYVHVRWERTPASIGLGLAVSRHLAQLMGGDLTYRRQSDVTVFELALPAAD